MFDRFRLWRHRRRLDRIYGAPGAGPGVRPRSYLSEVRDNLLGAAVIYGAAVGLTLWLAPI